VFTFSIVVCLLAAAASWVRGGKFVYTEGQEKNQGLKMTLKFKESEWEDIFQEAISCLSELIRFKTVNPPGNEKPAADYLAEILSRNGIEPTSGLWSNCNPTGTTYLHEDGDPCGDANVAGTGPTGPATQYSTPHIASQGDVLMGRNAYFMGAAGTPHLSKHSNVADACVGCHMELNPDGVHVFEIDPAKKPQVCANCHGSTTGEALKAQVEGLLDQLGAKIGSKIAGVLTGSTLTYTVRAYDPNTDCYSSSSSSNSISLIVTFLRILALSSFVFPAVFIRQPPPAAGDTVHERARIILGGNPPDLPCEEAGGWGSADGWLSCGYFCRAAVAGRGKNRGPEPLERGTLGRAEGSSRM
jgi:hypothetical protein